MNKRILVVLLAAATLTACGIAKVNSVPLNRHVHELKLGGLSTVKPTPQPKLTPIAYPTFPPTSHQMSDREWTRFEERGDMAYFDEVCRHRNLGGFLEADGYMNIMTRVKCERGTLRVGWR